jgi:hypothetical protein
MTIIQFATWGIVTWFLYAPRRRHEEPPALRQAVVARDGAVAPRHVDPSPNPRLTLQTGTKGFPSASKELPSRR